MTKLFALLYNDSVRLNPGKRVLSPEEYSSILSAEELVTKVNEELAKKHQELEEAMAKAREEAVQAGFQEGLAQWAQQMAEFEKAAAALKRETEKNIVPVAIKAAAKIVGREVEQKPETFLEIVRQSLKAISQHRRFVIYVNPKDLPLFEAGKPKLKEILEHAESIALVPREEQAAGSCTVETEAGIINVEMEALWKSLESAFQQMVGG